MLASMSSMKLCGQDLAGKSHCDAVQAMGQGERELHRQGDGLLVASVIGELPGGGLGIERHFEREFG
jgi:hypothetical protein